MHPTLPHCVSPNLPSPHKRGRFVSRLLTLLLAAAGMSGAPCFGAAPDNDPFNAATSLSGARVTIEGSNAEATIESFEPLHAHLPGGHSVWWTWTAPGAGTVEIDTLGSDFDTTLGVYTGTSITSLEELASNDDDGDHSQSRVSLEVAAGTAYRIAMDGYGGATGAITLHLTFKPRNDAFANRIELNGVNVTAEGTNEGATGEMGEPNHAGQSFGNSVWWSWTAPVTGRVNVNTLGSDFDTLLAVYTGTTVGNLAEPFSGNSNDDIGSDSTDSGLQSSVTFDAIAGTVYQIAVDGFRGRHGTIKLTAHLLYNDHFAARIDLIGNSITTAASNVGATREPFEPVHPDGNSNSSLWWTWTAPKNGRLNVNTLGSDINTILAVYTGTTFPLTSIASNDDAGSTLQSSVIINAISGTTYQIAVDGATKAGYSTYRGAVTLNLDFQPAPENDDFAHRSTLQGNNVGVVANTLGATREDGEPNHAGNAGGSSVWWQWTATHSGTVVIDTLASDFDTLLAVYQGDSLAALVPIQSNDNGFDGPGSRVVFEAVAGQTYQLAVDGKDGDVGKVSLRVFFGPSNDDYTHPSTLSAPPPDSGGSVQPSGGGLTLVQLGGTVTTETDLAWASGGAIAFAKDVFGLGDFPLHTIPHLNDGLHGNSFSWISNSSNSFCGVSLGATPKTLRSIAWSRDQTGVFSDRSLGLYTLQYTTTPNPTALTPDNQWTTIGTVNYVSAAGAFPTALRHQYNFTAIDATGIRIISSVFGTCIDELELYANPGAFLTGASYSVVTNGSTVGATSEIGENFGSALLLSHSVWWDWIAPASGVYRVIAQGTGFAPVVAIVEHRGDDFGVEDVHNIGEGTGENKVFIAQAGQNYQIAVGGDEGAVSLNLTQVPPPANDEVTNAEVLIGANPAGTGTTLAATTGVDERGLRGVWWRWLAPADGYYQLDSTGTDDSIWLQLLTGNEGDRIEMPQFSSSHRFEAIAGTSYYLFATGGSNASIRFSFLPLSRPANDSFVSRIALSGAVASATGTTLGATREPQEPEHVGAIGGHSLWWSWTAPATGRYVVDASGNSYWSVSVGVYEGTTLGTLSPVQVLNRSNGEGSSPGNAIAFEGIVGHTYQITLDSYEEASVKFRVAPTAENDDFANPQLISGAYVLTEFDANLCSWESGETIPALSSIEMGGSLWWTWIAPSKGQVTIATRSAIPNLFSGSTPQGLTPLPGVASWPIPGMTYEVNAGSNYQIGLFRQINTAGAGQLELRFVPDSSLPPIPANDNFANATPLSGQSVAVTGSLGRCSLEPNEVTEIFERRSVWYTWTCPASGIFEINNDGASHSIFLGDSLSSLEHVPLLFSQYSRTIFVATAGESYRIRVYGYTDESFRLDIAAYVPEDNSDFRAARFLDASAEALNIISAKEPAEPNHANLSGGNSLWWEWTASSTGLMRVDTEGATIDTLLAVYTGETLSNLTPIAANNDASPDATWSKLTFRAVAGQTYKIAVDGVAGAQGKVALNLQAIPDNDDFASRPILFGREILTEGRTSGATVEPGEPSPIDPSIWWTWIAPSTEQVRISVTGDASPYLFIYTGKSLPNLVPLPGISRFSKEVTFSASMGATYQIQVLSRGGSVAMQIHPSPENDDFSQRISLSGSIVEFSGNNLGATADPEAHANYRGGENSLWWTWISPQSGWFSLRSLGSSPVSLTVYTGNSLDALASITNGQNPWLANAGTSYQIAVAAGTGHLGDFSISLAPAERPANDDFVNREVLVGFLPTATVPDRLASAEPNEPPHASGKPAVASLWWTWTAPLTGPVQVTANTEYSQANVAIYTGSSIAALTHVGFGNTSVSFTAIAGKSYQIAVDRVSPSDPCEMVTLSIVPFSESQPTQSSPGRPSNDDFANRAPLTGSDPTTIATTTEATVEVGEYIPSDTFGNPHTHSVWWTWTAPFSGDATIDLINGESDSSTSLSVYTGNSVPTLKQIATNILASGSIGGPASFSAVEGTEYQIALNTLFRYSQLSLRLSLRQPAQPASPEKAPLFLKRAQIEQILVQPDGKIIIRGDFEFVNSNRRYGLARVNTNGSVDATWIPKLDGPIYDMAASESALFIVGAFRNVGDQIGHSIARIPLSGDGNPDLTWKGDNVFFANFGAKVPGVTIAVQGENVYAAGGRFRVRILNESGNGSSKGEIDVPFEDWRSLKASPTRVVAGGIYQGGETLAGVIGGGGFAASIHTNTFDGWGVRLAEFGGTDDELIVTGDFIFPLRHELAKMIISGPGTLDGAWRPEPNGKVKNISVLRGVPEAHVFVTGDFSQVGGRAVAGIAKLNVAGDGAADARFSADVLSPGAVLATTDGVYVAASYPGPQKTTIHGLARLDPVSGERDKSFNVRVQGGGVALAIARQPDGKVIVGGDFEFAGDVPRKNLARFDEDGLLDETWSPNVDGPVKALACGSQSVYVGGDFSHVGTIARKGLAKVAIIGSSKADPLWDPLGQNSGTVNAITVSGTGVYVGGQFTRIGGLNRLNLAKLAPTGLGAADPLWLPQPTAPVTSLALDGANLYAAGDFVFIGGQLRNKLAQISTTGVGAATVWNPSPNGPIFGLAVRGDVVYATGDFTSIGGQPRAHLARLGANGPGLADSGWNPFGAGAVLDADSKVAVTESGGTIFVTGLSQGDGKIWGGLARINGAPGGTIDPEWDPSPTPSGSLAMAIKEEGLYVAGGFNRIGGSDVSGIAFFPGLSAPRVILLDGKLVIVPGGPDGSEVAYFQIVAFPGGTLSLPDGTPIAAGQFITSAQGLAGLKFTGQPQLTVFAAFANSAAATGKTATTTSVPTAQPAVFQFSSDSYSVTEGLPGSAALTLIVPVKRLFGPAAGTVTYSILDGTATALAGGGQDYQDFTGGSLIFGPTDSEKVITFTVRSDEVFVGDRVFYVQLNSVPAGSVIGVPSRARIQIIDSSSDSGGLMTTVDVGPRPAAEGTASVTLDPEITRGRQWRLQGSLVWLESGATLGGLLVGEEYRAEFRPIHGYQQPSQSTIVIQAGGATERKEYRPMAAIGHGSLRIHLFPDSVATDGALAHRGQWRLEGESAWRDGDSTAEEVPGLEAGTYRLEFKDVSNRVTPPLSIVTVVANQTNELSFVYGEQQELTGAAPTVVPLATASTEAPYIYNGQLSSRVGYGSGCVVGERTVLTAAHVVFDDLSLSWVPDSELRWMFQRYHGSYEPQPQTPEGRYIFSGYQAQRTADGTPGISTSKSQGMDVAAVYFPSSVGRGGHGGYLLTDERNDWLADPERNKMLTGYPLPPGREADWEKLWATNPAPLTFTKRYPGSTGPEQHVYVTTNIHSFPGNSGGPLYVQHEGKYFPAGIILGGSAQTLVRAIDRQVVDLIRHAEEAAGAGGNITGGGLDYVSADITYTQRTKGFLKVTLHNSGAQWRLAGETSFHNAGERVLLEAKTYAIEFSTLTGFQPQQPQPVEVIADQMAILDIDYAPVAADFATWQSATYHLSGPANGDTDGDGMCDLMEFAVGGNPTTGWDKGTLPIAGTYKNSVDPDDPNAEIFPTITFRKRRRPNAGITYTVVESDRPEGPWTVVLANPNAQDPYVVKQSIDSDEFEILTVRGTQSLNGEGAPPSWFLKVLVKEK